MRPISITWKRTVTNIDEGDDDVAGDGEVERAAVALGDAVVDAVAHEERPGEHRQR